MNPLRRYQGNMVMDRTLETESIIRRFGQITPYQLKHFIRPVGEQTETSMEETITLVHAIETVRNTIIYTDDTIYAIPRKLKDRLSKDRNLLLCIDAYLDYIKSHSNETALSHLEETLIPDYGNIRIELILNNAHIISFIPVTSNRDLSMLLLEDEKWSERLHNMKKTDCVRTFLLVTTDAFLLEKLSALTYHMPVVFSYMEYGEDGYPRFRYLPKDAARNQ